MIAVVRGSRGLHQWHFKDGCGSLDATNGGGCPHRQMRKEANQSIRPSAHRGIRLLTGFRPILLRLAPGTRPAEPTADLTGEFRSTQWWIPIKQPSIPTHSRGIEGWLIGVAGVRGYPFFGKPRVAHEWLSSTVSAASSSNSSLPSKGQGADVHCRPE